METHDFSGWATRSNVKCDDGRVIKPEAFKHCDGITVPLVWQHNYKTPSNVLGKALLKHNADGVYAYCTFNDTEGAVNAKKLVEHGDVVNLSIHANQLKQSGADVVHGTIREVSLVLAGSNPGATIESVIKHGLASDEEATIFTEENIVLDGSLSHATVDEEEESDEEKKEDVKDEEDSDDETIADVFATLTEKQKKAVFGVMGQALKQSGIEDDEDDSISDSDINENSEGGTEMKHNVFESETDPNKGSMLTHDAMKTILSDAKRIGSFKESFKQYCASNDLDETTMIHQASKKNSLTHAGTYGIDNIEYLFPDARNVTDTPGWISREMGWVQNVMSNVHKTPFSRIKSLFADITEDAARAKGYIKGNMKKEEVFSLLRRTTDPQTVYKKQKMDRDDVVDITDFDVVTWLRAEMRTMLDEEIARAILIGDGRLSSDDDKILEAHIRPIWTDEDLYTIKVNMGVDPSDPEEVQVKAFIRSAVMARVNYKGSGTPTLYTTESMLTKALLLEDTQGYRLYKSPADLAMAMRVKEIQTVEVMEGATRSAGGHDYELMGLIVNLQDYNVGMDRGGEINSFEQFDIDYNQQKYLIETRLSGAMVRPHAAIALELTDAPAG